MQNTNGKMRNEKNAKQWWLVHTSDHVTATITELTSWQHQMLTLDSSLLCSDFTCERGICYVSASVCSRPIHLLLSQTGILQKWMIRSPAFYIDARTHTCLTALFPGLPGWADTRNVKPIWVLLKQETVSGSGISWAICKSAPRCRQITTPAPHHSVFYRPNALPAAQPTASKHWRHFALLLGLARPTLTVKFWTWKNLSAMHLLV